MNTIRLSIINNHWYAEFPDDAEIAQLFGDTLLPTPFTDKTAADFVVKAIQERNPGYWVEVI